MTRDQLPDQQPENGSPVTGPLPLPAQRLPEYVVQHLTVDTYSPVTYDSTKQYLARGTTHLLNGDPEVALDIAEMFALSKLHRKGIATMRVRVVIVSPLVVSHGGANRLVMGGGVT